MANPENPQSKVFISYSRKDKPFVKKLNDSLDNSGIAAWVDWEGIPPSADWMAEITRAIESGDAFIFVISPDSLASKICMDELELGIKYNKKIIPVLYRDPEKRTKMHPKLASTNWIYLRKEDNYKANLPKIFDSINTDLEWIQQHTRILQRATEWEQKNQNKSFLLGGTELEESEKWMTASTTSVSRQVAPIQAEFISIGRKVAVQRQRNFTIGVALALVVSLAMGVFAFVQRGAALVNEQKAKNSQATAVAQQAIAEENKKIAEENAKIAEENAQIAKAQRSASEAKIYQDEAGELDTSTLLAIDAYTHLPSLADAETIIRHNITLLAIPIKQTNVEGRVWTIQLSPDRQKFATADEAGNACLWDTNDGSQYFCAPHESAVYDSAFSSDGKILVTGTEKGVVTFWDVETEKQLSSLQFDGTIWDLNMNPNGRWLGVGRTNMVSLIDMTDFKEEIFLEQKGEVYSIDFDDSGAYMAYGTSEGFVTIWTVMQSRTVAGAKHTNEVYDVEFSPDGQWVISGGADSTTRATRVAYGGEKYFIKHGDWVEDVSFGPDNTWFATVSDDKFIRVIDTATGQERMRMAHANFVLKTRVSKDGQWIATTGYDQTVRVWDAHSGAEVLQLPIEGIGSSLQFNADGSRLIAGDRDGRVYLWDISNLKSRKGLIQFNEFTREAHFSPDGSFLLVNSDDKNIWLVNTDQAGTSNETRKVVAKASGLTYSTTISPDSKWIAAVEYDSNVSAYNRVILIGKDGSEKHYLDHKQVTINAVTFTPDNKQIITSDENGLINIWDLSNLTISGSLQAKGNVISLGISPDGKYLVAGTDEEGQESIVFDLSTKTQTATLDQFGSINTIEFTSDGKTLATSGSEGILYLWNAEDSSFARIQSEFKANAEIKFIDFSPDNKYLALGDDSGFVYIWDMVMGQEVARLPHISSVTSVSFTPDGKELATVSLKTVMLWDMEKVQYITKDQLIDTACSRLTENFDIEKWKTLFFDEEYRAICPNLPTDGN